MKTGNKFLINLQNMQSGWVELVALGLLAALILVLALPLFSEILITDDYPLPTLEELSSQE